MGKRSEAHPGQEAAAHCRALAAETLPLERTLSDLVNQAYGLTSAEIYLMWKSAPPRMPIPPPVRTRVAGLSLTFANH